MALSKSTINKVLRLAQYGATDGEKDAARTVLVTNGIDPDQQIEEEAVYTKVNYKTAFERDIIWQIVSRLTNTSSIYATKMNRHTSIRIPAHLEKRLHQDVKTIIPLWRKELKKFLQAFVIKNELYSTGDEPEHENKSGLSQDEIQDIIEMARSITKANLCHLFGK
jgi:hypothetical protein